MTAADVLALLRRYYLPEGRTPAGLFLPEIASPDGRRRADLIWVPTSIVGASSGPVVGHEIKVSRADVVAELADPSKPDPWLQYCHRWWLVVADPRLVDGLDIPDLWGVMAPPSGRRTRSMTVLRTAPRLRPSADMAPVVTRLAVYTANRLNGEVSALRADRDALARDLDRLRATVSDLQQRRDAGDDPRARRVAAILASLDHGVRSSGWWVRDVSDEDVAAALVDLARVRAISADLRSSIERTVAALSVDVGRSARERLAQIGADLGED